ncbi:MAG: thioredoxin domain-containing protein [Candidatus Binataceae bacterium]
MPAAKGALALLGINGSTKYGTACVPSLKSLPVMHWKTLARLPRIAVVRLVSALIVVGFIFAGLREIRLIAPDLAHAGDTPALETSHDAALKAALQKQFLIPNIDDIALGSATHSPFSGLWERSVTFSNAQGQKATYPIYLDSSENRVIIGGRYVDTSHPWQKLDVNALHLKDRPTLGPADAPVTIIEFADFECPFCKRAFNEIETLVNTTYRGKVHLIWKNYPLIHVHPWAEQAAIAAECARRQNPQAFWTFAHDFYRDQDEISVENLRRHIDDYASDAGLDGKALNACVLGDAAQKRVQQDLQDGQALHLESTPTFIINGVPVVGLPSGNVFDFVITSQLKQQNAAR